MLNKVRIFKINCEKAYMMSEQGAGLSLIPWGDNTEYYVGSDDGGTVYDLPEEFELSFTQSGELAIYKGGSEHADLVLQYGRTASLVTSGGIVLLKKSEDQLFENPYNKEEIK
jgi:hypothetical protein